MPVVSHVFSQTAVNFTGTITGFNSQGSTTTLAATGLVRPQDWNSTHNEAYSLRGNTSLSSTASGSNVQFSGSGQVTLIGSSDTIVFAVANPFISQMEPWEFGPNTSFSSLGQSTLYLQHVNVPENLSINRMNRVVSLSINATLTASSNTTGGRSNSWGYSETLGIYSRQTGANSTALASYASNSWSMGFTQSVSFSSSGATSVLLSQSAAFGFPSQIDSTGGVTSGTFSSTATTSSGANSVTQANILSNITGIAQLVAPLATTLSAGDWWLAILGISSTTSAGTATNPFSMSNAILTGYTSDFKMVGQTATATGSALVLGQGFWNAQVAALTSPIPYSSINNNSNNMIYFNVAEQTYP